MSSKVDRMMKLGALAAFVLCMGFAAQAEWKPFKVPTQQISTLIMTGNFAKSRLLAELIQVESKQPILLLPAKPSGKIYFMPPKNRGTAIEVPRAELSNFIRFLDPQQIMILGDIRYVPMQYRTEINEYMTVWNVYNTSWYKSADSIGRLMNLTDLSRDYRRLLNQLVNEKQYWRNDDPRKNGGVPAVELNSTLPADELIEIEETETITADTTAAEKAK